MRLFRKGDPDRWDRGLERQRYLNAVRRLAPRVEVDLLAEIGPLWDTARVTTSSIVALGDWDALRRDRSDPQLKTLREAIEDLTTRFSIGYEWVRATFLMRVFYEKWVPDSPRNVWAPAGSSKILPDTAPDRPAPVELNDKQRSFLSKMLNDIHLVEPLNGESIPTVNSDIKALMAEIQNQVTDYLREQAKWGRIAGDEVRERRDLGDGLESRHEMAVLNRIGPMGREDLGKEQRPLTFAEINTLLAFNRLINPITGKPRPYRTQAGIAKAIGEIDAEIFPNET